MNRNDLPVFSKIMTGMAEIFGCEITEIGMELRFRALNDFSIRQIEAAAQKILKGRKWAKMPLPGDFRDQIEVSIEDTAEIEAMRVLRALKGIGRNESVDFQDQITHMVILERFGGWIKLCSDLQVDQEKWFLRDFAATYALYARNGIEVRGGHLSGLIEDRNSANGFYDKIPKPIVIERGSFDKFYKIPSGDEPEVIDVIDELTKKLFDKDEQAE